MATRKARPVRPAAAAASAVAPGATSTTPRDATVDAATDPLVARAAEGMLGPNPFVGLRGEDLLASLGDLTSQAVRQPQLLLEQQATLARDLISVVAGNADLAPDAADKRFQDTAWTSNPFYRGLLQGHLAWRKALAGLVERSALEGANKERASFVVQLLTDAFTPTNTLIGNPGAVKKLVETGGMSAVKGLQNLLQDIASNQGMPAQVDTRAFEVGRDLALTPGAVVFRNEVLELIQYTPTTAKVYARPQLLVPPQVNKFYVFDMAPGKSLIEFLVGSGFQTFTVSWRNPTPAQRHWDMGTYVEALLEAIAAVRAITGSDDVNLHGACSGAMTMSALLGHLAARGERLVNAATLMVAVLDSKADSQLGTFVTPETIATAKRNSAAKGVLDGREMGRVFAWMRPNDLVWNYWVNNYLLGNPPPVFDILFWNNDTTRLAAAFHGQLLDIFANNLLVEPGAFEVLGTTVDLARVDCDKYLVAGMTDHITPWKGVFNTARAFGGDNTFVVSSSGHIQSLINPPGNPKSKYLVNPVPADDADAWLAGAKVTPDTWWNHWREWLEARSGKRVTAPATLGNDDHPPREAAPGTYVREK